MGTNLPGRAVNAEAEVHNFSQTKSYDETVAWYLTDILRYMLS